MGYSTHNPTHKLLRGLGGLLSAAIIGVISAHEHPSRACGLIVSSLRVQGFREGRVSLNRNPLQVDLLGAAGA